MKYIKKDIKNEPSTLKNYREQTPEAIYYGFTDTGQLLKKALLEEQKYICAYCNRRISFKPNSDNNKPMIEVEHVIPQNPQDYKIQEQVNKKHLDLDYLNMVGVCNGTFGIFEHCDKSKKDQLLKKVNPLNNNCESLIKYNSNGDILPIIEDNGIELDLKLLNLNDDNLINCRRDAIYEELKNFIKLYPKKDWTKKLFQKRIDELKQGKKGKYEPFIQIRIWYWQNKMKLSRYK